MKKKNFNPENYYQLNNLRQKVIDDVIKNININNKKILEIGSGNGTFTRLLAKNFKNNFINAIDIVENYVCFSKQNSKQKNIQIDLKNVFDIKSTFDVIFMFFSLTELLKEKNIKEILNDLNEKVLVNGNIIIVENFNDDYEDKKDLLGLKILEELGYKHLNYKFFQEQIKQSNFEIVYSKVYDNKQNVTNEYGTKLQIFYENKLNEYDKTMISNSYDIWNKFKKEIKKEGGIRTYNKSRLIILKKKNNILKKLDNINEDLCLYYSLKTIENNIKYYNDFEIDNLKYVFPVKTFPNDNILKLFFKYNFYYDVSHKKELKLVEKYDTLFFYSDPTQELINQNYFRLNINHINSHFGLDYDNKSYEIYHIHISANKTKNIQKKILKQISLLDFSNTKYLNIGGGYEKMSYLDLKLYLEEIRRIVPRNVVILLEAGSLWFKDSGYLITKAKQISNIRGRKFVYLNACRTIHTKWSVPLPIGIRCGKDEYIICGSSCDEQDLFGHIYNSNISIGNRVYFSKIEPYSYSFNTTFNGIEKAKVIIDE